MTACRPKRGSPLRLHRELQRFSPRWRSPCNGGRRWARCNNRCSLIPILANDGVVEAEGQDPEGASARWSPARPVRGLASALAVPVSRKRCADHRVTAPAQQASSAKRRCRAPASRWPSTSSSLPMKVRPRSRLPPGAALAASAAYARTEMDSATSELHTDQCRGRPAIAGCLGSAGSLTPSATTPEVMCRSAR